jgi:hypothetical protein
LSLADDGAKSDFGISIFGWMLLGDIEMKIVEVVVIGYRPIDKLHQVD